MLLDATNVAGLTTGFKANFNQGFNAVQTAYSQIATVVPSGTASESYPFLGDFPAAREWVGDRYVHKLRQHGYSIANKAFELTVEVDRDAINDDQYGVYAPMFENLGQEAARFPDQLVFELLIGAFTTLCYDGQYMVDADHIGYDADGNETTVSNSGGGSGNPWFLMDTSRALKPLIYQEREPFQFGLVDGFNPSAPVPARKNLQYGMNGRCNVGFGFWQQLYGSKATLNATNFDAAFAAMGGLRKASGKPMGIMPNLLVCGTSNRAAALAVLEAAFLAAGASNVNYKAVGLLITPWLP